MADWSWPGDDVPPVISLDDLARFVTPEPEVRISPEPVPGPGLYDPERHLPYGHSTGQHLLDPSAETEAEARLRTEVAAEVLELIDTTNSAARRDQALKALVTGDVGRAIGLLTAMLLTAWRTTEDHLGMPNGTTVRALRENLEGR